MPPDDAPSDLHGTRVLVTGATSGVGLEIARALGAAGADLVVPVRDRGKAERVLAGIAPGRLDVRDLDLASLDSVRALAAALRDEAIDVLVLNAGVALLGDRARQVTADGFELHFQANFLAHAVLARALAPRVRRVVVQGSLASSFWGVNWGDLQFARRYMSLRAYGSSKTALSTFGLELARRDPGLVVHLCHPGVVPATAIAPTLRGRVWPGLRELAVQRLGHAPAAAALPALTAITTDAAPPAFFAPRFAVAGRPRRTRLPRRIRTADGPRVWALTDPFR